MTNYKKAVEALTSQEKFHISLGLERISEILKLLGNPQDTLKCIHIAGTNGKGSVSCMLSTILAEARYKTGLFTSPHILEYTERIKINNLDIDRNDFAELIFEIDKLAKENDIYLTEFEILTAAGFKHFADNNVDICILETGLGGRFDATNVIKENLVSIITSISLDHTERLGDTIEKIAFEKAGIIKENSPVIINKNNVGIETIKEVAQQKNAKIIITGNSNQSVILRTKSEESPSEINKLSPRDSSVATLSQNDSSLKNYAIIDGIEYEFSLLGLYQQDNLALVIETIKALEGFSVSDDVLKRALKKVNWPGRLQYIKSDNIIIDAAHNPDGAKKLRESLDYYFPDQKRIWIYGTLKNKDYKKIVNTLFRESDEIYLYDFDYPNRATAEEIADCTNFSVKQLQNSQIQSILGYSGLKIIAGSIYMIGKLLNTQKVKNNNFDKAHR